MDTARELVNIVIVGHVDHGKSTLVGRLLHDTNSLSKDKLEKVKRICKEQGKVFEYAFVMDAFEEEQKQGITIDVSRVHFSTKKRDYVIIDTPGHKEFLKNMFSGASTAEIGIILIDAGEGIQEQSKQHAYLLHLLGIDEIIIVVNKMDLIKCSQAKFNAIKNDYETYLRSLAINVRAFIPVIARTGANVCKHSADLKWYKGPTVREILDAVDAKKMNRDLPLRFSVQDVYKFDDKRIIAGRIEAGVLKVGDELLFSPENKVGIVEKINAWPEPNKPILSASTGESTAFTLAKQIFIERGQVASHLHNPPWLANEFEATLFWLGDVPLTIAKTYIFRFGTQHVEGMVTKVNNVITAEAEHISGAKAVRRHEAADLVIRTRTAIAFDDFNYIQQTGRFVVIDNHVVSGGGRAKLGKYPNLRESGNTIIKSKNISWHFSKITQREREIRYLHKGAVLWFTGLSGSGKSTIAVELEKALFSKGVHVFILDGDNIRHGLNANLGFSPDDRAENIRRIGEVAKLFAEAGLVVITAFISPYLSGREMVRKRIGENFIEVFIDCPIEVCEARDAKGLYKKARAGNIQDFTGVNAPYEPPKNPEIKVQTNNANVDECVEHITDYLQNHGFIPSGQ